MTQKEKTKSSGPTGGKGATSNKDEGKYFELPGAVNGEVVVRFPPEASGYLHIGHAKAALLNAHYQRMYNGKLVFRFDDTNPEKEKESFEKIIEGDVDLLEIKPDICSCTSDHFDLMLTKAEEMIRNGRAYVDDTPPEQMKMEREQKIESKNRANSVEKNLELWKEMVAGSTIGQTYCLRAKIDMQSDNGCLRDPTIYRCKPQEHPKTGFRYKVYPTYDFACPIVDSIEGVTHSLRTSEYMDRDVQYYWFCDAMQIRKPLIASYSRLNLMNTVLSKRKLTFFVQEGIVDGWDDPRMPTVRGILRRGLTVEGLKQFIASQGSSKSVVVMEWDKIWSFNRKVIDPIAPRYSAVETADSVTVNISDTISSNQSLTVPMHPKNPQLGQRSIPIGNQIVIDQTDAQLIQPNTSVTFINWGNLKITNIQKEGDKVVNIDAKLDLDNKDFKKTLKVTWLEKQSSTIPAMLIYYDHIIKKPVLGKDDDFKDYMNRDSKFVVRALVDSSLDQLKKGQIIQIQRKGFFICDEPYDAASTIDFTGKPKPIYLISIPDGSTDLNIFPKVVQEWRKANAYVEESKTKTSSTSAKVTSVAPKSKPTADTSKLSNQIAQLTSQLSTLKLQYKQTTNKEWSPEQGTSPSNVAPSTDALVSDLDAQIRKQGDLIRKMKSDKAAQSEVKPEVDKLLALKAEFKKTANVDWKPDFKPPSASVDAVPNATTSTSNDGSKLDAQIKEQGDLVRKLKADKADKSSIDSAVQQLLSLKSQFKATTGIDWKPESVAKQPAPAKKAPAPSKQPKEAKANKHQPQPSGDSGNKLVKKQTRLGMETKKSDNYSEWYTEVITKAEMIEYYDVSGCYILRPWSYAIWEQIQKFFDAKIKSIGVVNCYFPMFISKSALETEKTHIADFAPEVAWVTKSGQSELAEPIAIRPTSETVMYPSYAKWVQSHRDLPIQLNQWCNVVRWEFKQPTPFLRTREFLWQEGHSAFATKEETLKEVFQILDYYAQIYEYLLAIPVVKGRKTEKEKFAGGDMTTTCEAYVDVNGRGIQGGTSHYLGQNFSKMFDLSFEDPDKLGEKRYAYQTSWGLSTRTIGAVIMIHGDDKGLVLPPRVAALQVVIVPCGITANTVEEEKKELVDSCHQLASTLKQAEIRVRVDDSEQHSPGWKFNHWELKGVPIRVEIGPKDLSKNEFVTVRRDSGAKESYKITESANVIKSLLESIQQSMFERAKQIRDDRMIETDSWDTFLQKLDCKFIILSPFCGEPECEDQIKKDSQKDDSIDASGGPLMGAKSLCIPLEQPKPIADGTKCIHPNCSRTAKFYTLFGRSY